MFNNLSDEVTLTLTLLKANCWFFCSVVHEHLQVHFKGVFVHGRLKHVDLARSIRHRIDERLGLPSQGPDGLPQSNAPDAPQPPVVSAQQPCTHETATALGPNYASHPAPTFVANSGTHTSTNASREQDDIAMSTIWDASSVISTPASRVPEGIPKPVTCPKRSVMRRLKRIFRIRK